MGTREAGSCPVRQNLGVPGREGVHCLLQSLDAVPQAGVLILQHGVLMKHVINALQAVCIHHLLALNT